jgi:dTDP-4-dehydrorhamnose 3,5-epimerase-like enzyme
MNKSSHDLWIGLDKFARLALTDRNYKEGSFTERVSGEGVDAHELTAADRRKSEAETFWIPGVEIFLRTIHVQRHRGLFGEFARKSDGPLAKIGLWPEQWAAARMFAHSSKGFHIHPPSIPHGTPAAKWHRRLFIDEPENYELRPYDREQWDVMFFVQGRAEMILRDARAGLPTRTMHFFVDGDNHRSASNAAVIIPPGVAHALRVEGSEDLIMVYGTSTPFHPEFEGRIASEVETSMLPESWQQFLK